METSLLKVKILSLLVFFAGLVSSTSSCFGDVIFYSDFESGLPSQFSGGSNEITSVQGWAGLGTGSNQFAGSFLRNQSGGNPAQPTVLTLSNLPTHTSVDLKFLLAVIDSWDGTHPVYGTDLFNVRVDGNLIFSKAIQSSDGANQGYTAPPGGELAFGRQLGFTSNYLDAAYNLGLDPAFSGIAHTSSSLTIEWYASGNGWTGGGDESWAIDNLSVNLNGSSVPEPTSLGLVGLALGGFLYRSRRKKNASASVQ